MFFFSLFLILYPFVKDLLKSSTSSSTEVSNILSSISLFFQNYYRRRKKRHRTSKKGKKRLKLIHFSSNHQMEKEKEEEEERISFLFTRNSIFSVANSFELRRSSIPFIQYMIKNKKKPGRRIRMSKERQAFLMPILDWIDLSWSEKKSNVIVNYQLLCFSHRTKKRTQATWLLCLSIYVWETVDEDNRFIRAN